MANVADEAAVDTDVSHEDDGNYVALTSDILDAKAIMDKVRSPKVGAIVLFAGNDHALDSPTGLCKADNLSRHNSR